MLAIAAVRVDAERPIKIACGALGGSAGGAEQRQTEEEPAVAKRQDELGAEVVDKLCEGAGSLLIAEMLELGAREGRHAVAQPQKRLRRIADVDRFIGRIFGDDANAPRGVRHHQKRLGSGAESRSHRAGELGRDVVDAGGIGDALEKAFAGALQGRGGGDPVAHPRQNDYQMKEREGAPEPEEELSSECCDADSDADEEERGGGVRRRE